MPTVENTREAILAQLNKVQAELELLRGKLSHFDVAKPAEHVSAEWIRSVFQARRRREKIFPRNLFSDHAWDILLLLHAARLANEKMRNTDLRKAAGLADATAGRWITGLEQEGLIERIPDDCDRRQVFIRLSGKGLALMNRFFENPQVGGAAI